MSYKNKIKDYKANVDLEAWQGMENLLDSHAQSQDSIVAKGGFFSSIKNWLSLFGIILILILGSIYLLPSSPNGESTLSIISEEVEEKQYPNNNEELILQNNVESEPKVESKVETTFTEESEIGVKKDIANNVPIQLKNILESNETSSALKETQLTQPIKSNENLSQNDRQSQVRTSGIDSNLANSFESTINNFESNNLDSNNIGNSKSSEAISKEEENNIPIYSKEESKESKSLQNTINNTNNSNASESESNLSTELDANIANDELDNIDIVTLLDIESIQLARLSSLESNQEVLLGTPDIILPQRILSKYLVGLDIGATQYLNNVSGSSISIFGVYEIQPWLRAGVRLNWSNMGEKTNYVISPNITRKRSESVMDIYTQIVPVRFWRINLGIEVGYGVTAVEDRFRRSENPEPNVISIREEIYNYPSRWFYLGAHFTIDITPSIKLGTTVGTNTGTESAHFSGRLVYRI